jgi:putative cell wall-binding protein
MKTPLRASALIAVAMFLSFTGTAAHADEARLCPLTQNAPSSIERIGGPDRFAVSAAVSASTFTPGVPVAFLASGSTFPDALSGSAAAGYLGGPVLLVNGGNEVPTDIAQELSRLKPQKIVVLGGTAAISETMELTMERFAPIVRRIAGADRFEVSAALAGEVGRGRGATVYIASGTTFPDALSAAAAAGDTLAPVLLVTRESVPQAIVDRLQTMEFLEQIVVVGGPAAVSDSVVAQLGAFAKVRRVSGADRFVVSAATSADRFCADNRTTAFVASGENFPDALSGSAAAIAYGGPVLLVRRDAIPEAIAEELRRLKPQRIVVLGGEQAVAKSVELELAGFLRK